MFNRVRSSLKRFAANFFLRFANSSQTHSGKGTTALCFQDVGWKQFGIFHSDGLPYHVDGWWTVEVEINSAGELVSLCFARNQLGPGDIRLTGLELHRAYAQWRPKNPPHMGHMT